MSEETLIPPIKAFEIVTGLRPHPSTINRWCTRIRGTRLRSWVVGGRRLTTIAEVRKFIDARTIESTPSHVRAETELDEMLA